MSELIQALMKIRESEDDKLVDKIDFNVCEEFVHVNISLAILRKVM